MKWQIWRMLANMRGCPHIARDNVAQGLDNAIALRQEQRRSLVILAILANPFDNGLDYWFGQEGATPSRALTPSRSDKRAYHTAWRRRHNR